MNVKFLDSREKKEIVRQLSEIYGIEELGYMLLQIGKEKIRAFSGTLTREEMSKIAREANIEIIGIYLCKIENDGLRLSHDSISILQNKITKNIIEINDEQAKEWMKGNDLAIQAQKSYVTIKNRGLIIGCGKSTGERIMNFIPKERRVKP
jgi:NOL1/NOP2/fmu family ribosome biogenesis protein